MSLSAINVRVVSLPEDLSIVPPINMLPSLPVKLEQDTPVHVPDPEVFSVTLDVFSAVESAVLVTAP